MFKGIRNSLWTLSEALKDAAAALRLISERVGAVEEGSGLGERVSALEAALERELAKSEALLTRAEAVLEGARAERQIARNAENRALAAEQRAQDLLTGGAEEGEEEEQIDWYDDRPGDARGGEEAGVPPVRGGVDDVPSGKERAREIARQFA